MMMRRRPLTFRTTIPLIARCMLAAVATTGVAHGDIDLELRPTEDLVEVGAPVLVELYAISDDKGIQTLAALDAIVAWNPSRLRLTGLEPTGIGSAGFPPDPFGLNESNPPADGDGVLIYFAPFSGPIQATPAGTLITTLRFTALAPASDTVVGMLENAGDPPGATRVFSGDTAGLDVLGTLRNATLDIVVTTCPADVDDDDLVGFTDLIALLSDWGACVACPTDVDRDGTVGLSDLLEVLGAWGACD
ncbi:MAG: hypothetical protein HKN62_02015 [Phycisphaerales bacterium]|nr:hypothetical protein [Phycisphaerales bacterium]